MPPQPHYWRQTRASQRRSLQLRSLQQTSCKPLQLGPGLTLGRLHSGLHSAHMFRQAAAAALFEADSRVAAAITVAGVSRCSWALR